MLTALRQEVRTILDALPTCRPPCLRRCDRDDFLFATDAPTLCEPHKAQRALEAGGWRTCVDHGWLYLDKLPPPPLDPPQAADGELGCCLSILHRHPGGENDDVLLRALLKSAESGHIQRFCRTLHRELAQKLRRHDPLPSSLWPYLNACAKKENES